MSTHAACGFDGIASRRARSCLPIASRLKTDSKRKAQTSGEGRIGIGIGIGSGRGLLWCRVHIPEVIGHRRHRADFGRRIHSASGRQGPRAESLAPTDSWPGSSSPAA